MADGQKGRLDVAEGRKVDERGLLITLCKKLEKIVKKWKILTTFVSR